MKFVPNFFVLLIVIESLFATHTSHMTDFQEIKSGSNSLSHNQMELNFGNLIG